jgi:hypothetical protein
MNDAFYLFALSSGLAAALAAIAIWSPRALWVKLSALAVTALFLPGSYLTMVDLLSRPKPVGLEWTHRHLSDAAVLGANFRENQAIYLWLRVDGAEEPRAYVLPWDQRLAQQLYGAQRDAQAQGTALHVKDPFMDGRDHEKPIFYALPQPPLPPKEVPTETPHLYRPSTSR